MDFHIVAYVCCEPNETKLKEAEEANPVIIMYEGVSKHVTYQTLCKVYPLMLK